MMRPEGSASPGIVRGKDGYDPDREFDERTEKALSARARGEGPGDRPRDERLFIRDAVEVLSFVESDYRVVAPVLATLRRYRLLDLGCGYGRLAPFLSAFDCEEYLGVDRVASRLVHARERYGSRLCHFELADAVSEPRRHGGTEEDACPGRPSPMLPPFSVPPCLRGSLSVASRWDVVWTSNVLQHLLVEDKLRLVETACRARAAGGVILMREAEIMGDETDGGSRADAERRYASEDQARHMVPIPFGELAEAFRPLKLRRLGGIVYQASEG